MTLSKGTHIGPYEILSPLGAGGMGEVYRARDTKLNRDVALKVLPEILARDPERMARFKREAQVLASLNHPNIAAIHGFEESASTNALVMELVEGQTLAERIGATRPLTPSSSPQGRGWSRDAGPGEESRGLPLQLEEALPVAKQIAEALEYAHERGIIHRDLKPANIKITPEGTVKVLDFGLAKALETPLTPSPSPQGRGWPGGSGEGELSNSPTLTAAATQAGVIMGTAAYMPPEQARGKPVDRRADIWSFGCVLYEMLGGGRPFEGDTVTDVLAAVVRAEPDWDALPADTPPRIRELVRRCLIKDPKQRLQAIGDARIAIEETISGVGAIHELPLRVGGEAPPLQPWRRALLVAAGIALGATIAVLATLALTTGVFRKPKPQAVAARFLVPPPEGYTIAGDPSDPEVAVSPDGRMIAFAAVDSKGNASLWTRALDATTAHRLENTDGAQWPFWSPDSQYIGFVTWEPGKLLKIPAAGGSPQTICEINSWVGSTWNQEGVILLGQDNGPLMSVKSVGGEPVPATELVKGKYNAHQWPQFLPDGKHFLYLARSSSNSQDNAIYVGSLDSRQPKFLLENSSFAIFSPPGYLLFVRGGVLFAQSFETGRLELTGDPIRVVEGVNPEDTHAAYSASDNGVLAFRSGGSIGGSFLGAILGKAQLAWYSRKGKKIGEVGPPGAYVQAVLSPDEKRVVLQASADPKNPENNDLWMLDLTNGVYSRLTFDPISEGDPVWSPDSRQILYALLRPNQPELLQLTLGASQPKEFYADGKASFLDDWSPDGKFLIYHNNDNKSFFALPVTGERKPVPLAQDSFQRDQFHFSPDGKWVAYNSNESGALEVNIASFPKMDQKRQVSAGGGAEPMWRRDGKELYYLSLDNKLMAVSVTAGATLETGPPKELFQTNALNPFGGFDVTAYNASHDGQKFLVLEPAKLQATSAEQIHVIVNWDAALGK